MKIFSPSSYPSTAVILILFLFVSVSLSAQGQTMTDHSASGQVEIMVDTTITSTHSVTIKGESVPYRATIGNQPVWNEDGMPIATLNYTFYERTDIDDRSRRPLLISFNGGPGSASVWMHIGYTGPQKIKISNEGYPIQPYGVEDNPNSVLDVADIVYVNPVNTGFSRILDKETERSKFFGVNADIEYLAEWISTFVSRNNRWESPKFLIGESYGTTRVSGLANELQGSQWMFLNGVILVSPTGLGVDRDGPVGDALTLPYYAATAWYHDALPPELQRMQLDSLVKGVEEFTVEEFIPALAKGGSISNQQKNEIARQVAFYSGISEQAVLDHNLRISTSFFWKELLRDRGMTVGRLDSRYRGQDRVNAGERYDYDPALTSWNHAFSPAINHYLRNDLGYETDLKYWLFGPVHPWDRSGDNTGEDLRSAMAENPYLNLMVQSGYFDGGTPYFDAKYTMWNLDPGGRLQDRMRFRAYGSGHMMYLRSQDIITSNEDIRIFIEDSIPEAGTPAQY